VALSLAEIELGHGDLAAAGRSFGELADSGTTWSSSRAKAFLALVHALEGRLRTAESLANDATSSTATSAEIVAPAALALALVRAQRGQPGAASILGKTPAITTSRALRTVEAVIRARFSGTSLIGAAGGWHARAPLASHTMIALGVLETVDSNGDVIFVGGPAEAAVRTARLALSHDARAVLAALEPWTQPNAEAVHPRTLIEASVLAGHAASVLGHRDDAIEHLQRGLGIAAVEALWAPVLMHGPRVSNVLESVARGAGPMQRTAVVLLDETRRMQTPAYIERLTEQERAVLSFLPTLMSNAEIAAAMHLSTNTVKTHLKALYRKLGVDRRRDAVARGRQLELL
jgi:ATP/maltotriose-dependent transcriptional regulator MalT